MAKRPATKTDSGNVCETGVNGKHSSMQYAVGGKLRVKKRLKEEIKNRGIRRNKEPMSSDGQLAAHCL